MSNLHELLNDLNTADYDDVVTKHFALTTASLTSDLASGKISYSEYEELIADLEVGSQVIKSAETQATLQQVYQIAKLIYGAVKS